MGPAEKNSEMKLMVDRLQEVIDDIIIRDLRSEGHASDETKGIAVELLLIGLDEVSQVDGLPSDIARICSRLIAKFAASCGDHMVAVLGASLRSCMRREPSIFRSICKNSFATSVYSDFVSQTLKVPVFVHILPALNLQACVGQGFQPQQTTPDGAPKCRAKISQLPFAGTAMKGSCYGGTRDDNSDTSEGLFQVHWPGACEGLTLSLIHI